MLDLKQAEGFVLRKDLPGLVAVQVNRKPVGIESKLFGHLLQKSSSSLPLGGRNFLHSIWGLYPDDNIIRHIAQVSAPGRCTAVLLDRLG